MKNLDPNTKKNITIREIPAGLWNEFTGEAKKRGFTAGVALVEAIKNWLKKK